MAVLEMLLVVIFCVTMIVAPIAWLRALRSKTQAQYLKNVALFCVPILLVLALGALTGTFDEPTGAKPHAAETRAATELSGSQVILLSMAGGIWLGGGSLLWFRHTRRVGRSWWSVMNPLQPQFRDFNGREWLVLAALAMTSLSLGALAIHAG